MLLESDYNSVNKNESNLYVSDKLDDKNIPTIPNIIQTIYYPEQQSLYIFFYKQRYKRNKDKTYYLNENNEKVKNTIIKYYKLDNVSEDIYNSLKNSNSQGKFYNTYLKNDTTIIHRGNATLNDLEVKDILTKWNKYVKQKYF